MAQFNTVCLFTGLRCLQKEQLWKSQDITEQHCTVRLYTHLGLVTQSSPDLQF